MVAEVGRIAQLERDLDITLGLIYKWQQRYRIKDEVLQPSEERGDRPNCGGCDASWGS